MATLDIGESLPGEPQVLLNARIAALEALTEKTRLEALAQEYQNVSLKHTLDTMLAGPEHSLSYTFYNPIVGITVYEAMQTLDRWSHRAPGAPIEVVFCSPGGSVTDGFALYDFLRELSRLGHRLTTKGLGMVASMGAILLQAGDERVMTKNAFMMVHEVSSEGRGSLAELSDHLKMVERFQEKGLDILTQRATLSRTELAERWRKTDWFLDAEEALTFGLVDRIV